jgi:hypothetical protein
MSAPSPFSDAGAWLVLYLPRVSSSSVPLAFPEKTPFPADAREVAAVPICLVPPLATPLWRWGLIPWVHNTTAEDPMVVHKLEDPSISDRYNPDMC